MRQVFIVDMDGTLYRGMEPLPGNRAFLERLYGHDFLLITNCPWHAPIELSQKLFGMGMKVDADRIVTSGQLAARELARAGVSSVYTVGSPALDAAMRAQGIALNEPHPDAVLIGYAPDMPEERMARAAMLLKAGSRFFCTNTDMQIPVGSARVPHTGTYVRRLERETGLTAHSFGKPEPYFLRWACERFDCRVPDLWLIGDNLDTEIEMGFRGGAHTCLLLTGISTRADLNAPGAPRPERVYEDLRTLLADGVL